MKPIIQPNTLEYGKFYCFLLGCRMRNGNIECSDPGQRQVTHKVNASLFCVLVCAHMCNIKLKGDTGTLKSIQIHLAFVFLDHLHPPLPYRLCACPCFNLCFNSYLSLFTQLKKRFKRRKLHHSSSGKIYSRKGCI